MTDTILVTYASRNGSTAGIAKAIGIVLAEKGAQVAVRPMYELDEVTPYRAVVAGSAIQSGSWLPEALDFIRKNQADLKQKPFAAFLVCMTLAMKNEQWRQQANVVDWLAPVRDLVSPVSEGYFAGVLDIDKVPSLSQRIKFSLSVLSGVWAEGDHRDWKAIRAWAGDLKPLLEVDPAPEPVINPKEGEFQ